MKKERIEELEYVLGMYKNTLTILEAWDMQDLRSRIKKIEEELFAFREDVPGVLTE